MLLSPAGCVAEPRRHGVNATKRPRIAHAHACERARAHAHMHSRSRACIKHAGMQARHSASAPLAPWPCAGTAPPTAKHATTPAHENAASARRPCRSLPRPRSAMLKARARPPPTPPTCAACLPVLSCLRRVFDGGETGASSWQAALRGRSVAHAPAVAVFRFLDLLREPDHHNTCTHGDTGPEGAGQRVRSGSWLSAYAFAAFDHTRRVHTKLANHT